MGILKLIINILVFFVFLLLIFAVRGNGELVIEATWLNGAEILGMIFGAFLLWVLIFALAGAVLGFLIYFFRKRNNPTSWKWVSRGISIGLLAGLVCSLLKVKQDLNLDFILYIRLFIISFIIALIFKRLFSGNDIKTTLPTGTILPSNKNLKKEIEEFREQYAGGKVVLSLGGGAVRGLGGNVALLKVLYDLEVLPEVEEIWGTSAGAVIGGIFATNYLTTDNLRGNSEKVIKKLIRVITRLKKRNVLDVALKHILLRTLHPAKSFEGLFYGEAVRGMIQGYLGNGNLGKKNLPAEKDCMLLLPFYCIAAEDDSSQKKIFAFEAGKKMKKSEISFAIRASMGIQAAFMPIKDNENLWGKKGAEYVDGGVIENVPLPSIIENEKNRDCAKFIICSNYGYAGQQKNIDNALSRLFFIQDVTRHHLFKSHIREAERNRANIKLVVVNPMIYDVGMLAFERTGEVFDRAYKEFYKQLGSIYGVAEAKQTFDDKNIVVLSDKTYQ